MDNQLTENRTGCHLGTDKAPASLKSVCISLTLPVELYNAMVKRSKRKGLKNVQQLIIVDYSKDIK